MGNKLYEESSVQAIANAIRTKLGTDAAYKIGDMATAVSLIPTGITPTGSITLSTNGTYDVTNYASAIVDVNAMTPSYIKNPIEFDYTNGYVDTNGKWIYQTPSNNYLDIYTVEQGKSYKLMLGAVIGNRARGCLTTTDVRTLPAGSEVQGTFVGTANTFIPGTWFPFTSSIDGYLVFQKCNDSQADIQTYLFCVEEMTDAEPSGTKTIIENGEGIDVAGYSAVDVDVPPPAYVKLPIEVDYDIGTITYVSSDQTGTWTYNDDGTRRSDIYVVEQDKTYRLSYGGTPGSRFRAIVTETDVRTLPSGSSLTECQFVGSNQTPEAYASRTFTASVTGYLVLYKTQDSTDGIKSYLLDYSEM